MENGTTPREILFKARRTDNGEWVEGDLLQKGNQSYIARDWLIEGDNEEITCFDCGFLYEIDPATLCQCSNKTDKNGVKVFDGDICYDDFYECAVTIFYDKDSLRWAFRGAGWDSQLTPDWFKYLSVVGSIHNHLERSEE